MPPAETPVATLQRQLDEGRFEDAVTTADAILASNRRSFAAWLGRLRANVRLGRIVDADRDADEALRLAPADPHVGLLRATIDQRLGRIDRPREHMERIVARLGLPMDEAVLAPEANARTVLTLSHEQVRRSINRSSIGRWKNYEFAFGPEWG